MRCSDCSGEVKPIVALDIDGTLGNYHGHFLHFAEKWLGIDQFRYSNTLLYTGAEPFRVWFSKAYDVDFTTFRSIKLAYRQGGMKRTMPVYTGAWELVHAIRSAGAEVWLTTTRPWERYDRVDPDTVEWLRRNELAFDGLLYSEHKMDELAARVDRERVVAVLDDEAEQLELARQHGWAGILRRNMYNSGMDWPLNISELHSAARMIEANIKHWKGTLSC